MSNCKLLSDEDLLDILSQLTLAEKMKSDLDTASNGNMLFQDELPEGADKTTGLKRNYLYLDTCTTVNQMSTGAYLSNIHQVTKAMTVHCNSGSSNTKMKGSLGSMLFWLDRFGIANVVSLASLEEKYHVKYDSRERNGAFVCTTSAGEVVFMQFFPRNCF